MLPNMWSQSYYYQTPHPQTPHPCTPEYYIIMLYHIPAPRHARGQRGRPPAALADREFTKGGLVKGGLAITQVLICT